MAGDSSIQPVKPTPGSGRGVYVAGVILLVVGGLLLISELMSRLSVDWWQWPFVVTLVGLAFILVGLLTHQRGNPGFLVPGFIVLAVSGVLFYQNSTGHWESWAWIWPVVAPGGVAVAILLGGLMDGDGKQIRSGLIMLGVSLAMLLFFAIFFVGFIFGDLQLPAFVTSPWTGGLLFIAIGAGLLVAGLMRRS